MTTAMGPAGADPLYAHHGLLCKEESEAVARACRRDLEPLQPRVLLSLRLATKLFNQDAHTD